MKLTAIERTGAGCGCVVFCFGPKKHGWHVFVFRILGEHIELFWV
jgi:hypothetical protein